MLARIPAGLRGRVVPIGDEPVAALPWLGRTTATHPVRRIAAAATELLLGPD